MSDLGDLKPDWQSECGDYVLFCADCLEILPKLPDGCVDAVVTDPPYIIGAVSVGNSKSKSGTWADMENSAWWFARWMREAKRVTGEQGYLASFGNWRSIPTLICALSKADWSATSCVAWDKEWIGPAAKNALRPTYEVIMLAAKEHAEIRDRSVSDVWRCKWMAGHCRTTEHPAEKPVEIMERLLSHISQPRGMSYAPCNGQVLDPFTGSGTTGVACVKSGRKFIGIEMEPKYFDIAVKRIEGALAEQKENLFAEATA